MCIYRNMYIYCTCADGARYPHLTAAAIISGGVSGGKPIIITIIYFIIIHIVLCYYLLLQKRRIRLQPWQKCSKAKKKKSVSENGYYIKPV